MAGSNFTVLLVSPDRTLLRRAARFLEICGYRAFTATQLDQAAHLLHVHSPDFIVLDPAGQTQATLQLARQARERASGRTFTLLITNQPSVAELLEALQAGCDDFLSHPISFGEWLARLKGGARALEFERRLSEHREIHPVTGLINRRALERRIREFSVQARPESSGVIAFFQIDGGQLALQHAGHAIGSTLVRQARERFRAALPATAVGAHWDDAAFAVFWPGETEATVANWAERLRSELAPTEGTLEARQIKWSAGVVEWKVGESVKGWVECCLQALDLAAKSGGDCTVTGRQIAEASEAWSVDAAAGNLFAMTSARHVMSVCPLILSRDETVQAAAALLRQTGVSVAPVVDEAGNYVGTVTPELIAGHTAPSAQGRQSGSVRLLRHCVNQETPQFEENTSLADLLDFFGADPQPFAVVLAARQPIGIIYCEALACLSERLSPDALRPVEVASDPGSGYFLVPEVCSS